MEPQEEANKAKTDSDMKEKSNMFNGNHTLPTSLSSLKRCCEGFDLCILSRQKSLKVYFDLPSLKTNVICKCDALSDLVLFVQFQKT